MRIQGICERCGLIGEVTTTPAQLARASMLDVMDYPGRCDECTAREANPARGYRHVEHFPACVPCQRAGVSRSASWEVCATGEVWQDVCGPHFAQLAQGIGSARYRRLLLSRRADPQASTGQAEA